MQDEKGVTLNYTNKKHARKTKRLKYQHLIHNHKRRENILDIEKELKELNSKICNMKKFENYIKLKNKLNANLLEKYKDDIFSKKFYQVNKSLSRAQ